MIAKPQLVTIDFETYYSQTFSLTKMSTEEYVRSREFQVIGFAIKFDEAPATFHTGRDEELLAKIKEIDWSDKLVLAHNTMFDGAILNWVYGVKPRAWLDTLSMGRALHGVEAGGSLKALAERYGVGVKGTEVNNYIGWRRENFDLGDMRTYGAYCVNDVELTHKIFVDMMARGFPKSELHLIDLTLRMFVEPVLRLDERALEMHLAEVVRLKNEHLVHALQAIGQKELAIKQIVGDEETKAEVKQTLMSNPKFAEMLKLLNVEAPVKISPTTGKETLALAKSDEGFKALLEHPDLRVQALASARVGTKSTLEETRTERFIQVAKRGAFPVPLKYYAAHTGRWGGADSINLQNLPSRGDNANKLKKAILPPEGYVIIDCDSAQIEARCLAWEAGQDDLVTAFRNKEDVYKIMASAIYNTPIEEVTDPQRFVGKTTILGAGYGMGAAKFQAQLKTFGTSIDQPEADRIIKAYRATYPKIPQLWRASQESIRAMVLGSTFKLAGGLLTAQKGANGGEIVLPNGLKIYYNGLVEVVTEEGKREFQYTTRKGATRIYGGKLVENFTQAIARIIIGDQMRKLSKKYRVVLTVHDAIAVIARKEEADEARAYVEECMRWVPDWATGLPVNCESGMGETYGDC